MDEINVNTKAYSETIKRGKIIYKSLHRCKKNTTWPNSHDIKRIVAMSDIHGTTSEVIMSLIKRKIIDKDTIVICTGDMGGTNQKNGRSIGSY
uniref:Calcineurin-like phosphoesterase domain-containing protein n=1 Tax=viral metagenome TaxID=1070528 RepID=A0A6C0J5D4_9ZZZZ